MLFPTFAFAIFFCIVFAGSWALHRHHRLDKWFLILASYVFYAAWDWRFCGLLALSSCANHGCAHMVFRSTGRRRKAWVALAVAGNLALLGYFKYVGFFALSMDALLQSLHLPAWIPLVQVVLPVGISFFTFHGISYVVDVYRNEIPPARSLADVLLYIAFFPHLIAGPIVRAAYFLPQLERPRDPRQIHVQAAVLLIVFGLFKKVLIADLLGTELVDPAFLDPTRASALQLWAGMYGYAVQIFCDFSAYTDIATGVAALFGYRFPPNFDRPYGATSLRQFWTRWHISLSSWLRDYLYIPLGGNRAGAWRTSANLATTMVLGGLWHGANWTFVIWGVIHGTALVAERVAHGIPGIKRWLDRCPRALGWMWTFHVVCLGWVFFRAPDFTTAWAYLVGMFGGNPTPDPWILPRLAVLVVILGVVAHLGPKQLWSRVVGGVSRIPAPLLAVAAGICVACIAAWGPDGVPPFIYFAF